VNPGVARLAIVVALVVGGVVVLANGFSEGGATPTPSPGTQPTRSQSPSPATSPDDEVVPREEGVLVQVLNGTNAPGFAATFQTMLQDDGGYLPAGEAADAPEKPIIDTIVYFRQDQDADQNEADAGLLSETYLGGAPVEPLPRALRDVVDPAADVIVVLGEDQAGSP
jgi:hypothetical protein